MRLPAASACLLLTALLVAGCTAPEGDGESTTSSSSRDGGVSVTATASTTATSTSPSVGQDVDVRVVDDEFEDGTRTVPVGTTITYTNEGQRGHTVTIHYAGNNGVGGDPATTYKLDEVIQPGADASYTFAQPGTYHVFCRFHGTMTTGMTSTVTVA